MRSFKQRAQDVRQKADKQKNEIKAARSRIRLVWVSSVAATCCAVLLTFTVVFAGGYGLAWRYGDYAGVVSVLRGITSLQMIEGDLPPTADDIPDASNGIYVETTNNQVTGVVEADLLKCSSEYAFFLNRYDYTLNVYGLNGAELPLVTSYKITSEEGMPFTMSGQMYLSQDCNFVTLIMPSYNTNTYVYYTCLIALNVSDLNNIREVSRVYVSGSHVSSRFVGDSLLLFTDFHCYDPDYSDEAQFLPQIGTLGSMASIPAENIIYSEDASFANYTVAVMLDQTTLEVNSSCAFLSYTNTVYVSKNRIYLTRNCVNRDTTQSDYYTNCTEVACVNYSDGSLEYENTVKVNGRVLNQYSLDEYEDTLRVVTEVSHVTNVNDERIVYTGASLYCIDLATFEIYASYEEFSPNGENVVSVRFDGTTAYVCTALTYLNYLTDPVFAIDLSDLNNITSKDTGTIPGYSLSLVTFKDGTLLGIGYGESSEDLKIELYRQTDSVVQSVAAYELTTCVFSGNFKDYFIDAKTGLIGLAVFDYDNDMYAYEKYLLLYFDGYDLSVVETLELTGVYWRNVRAVCVGNYVYVFSYDGACVIDLNAQLESK